MRLPNRSLRPTPHPSHDSTSTHKPGNRRKGKRLAKYEMGESSERSDRDSADSGANSSRKMLA
jgi:hypothetical protein